jgi:hypothetical protein
MVIITTADRVAGSPGARVERHDGGEFDPVELDKYPRTVTPRRGDRSVLTVRQDRGAG